MKRLIICLLFAASAFAQIPCYSSGSLTANLGLSIPTPYSLNNAWAPAVNANTNCLDNYLSGNTALPALSISGYEDFLAITTPANPAANHCRYYFNVSTGLMAGINSSGASCGPSGSGGGSPGTPNGSLQWNSTGGFAGTIGTKYTLGTGNNPGIVDIDNQSSAITVTADYNFQACASGCTYTTSGATTLSAGSNTVTLTPVPLGVNGTDLPNPGTPTAGHYLLIVPALSDPTPIQEPVLIAGGTAVSGASSGTLTFNAAYAHAAGWYLQSASGGIQEAYNTASAARTTIKLVSAIDYYCFAPINLYRGNVDFNGQWAFMHDASISSCLVPGGGTWGSGSTLGESMDIHNIVFQPYQTNWSVQPTGSIAGQVANTSFSESGFVVTVISTLNPGTGTNNVVLGGTSQPNYNGIWSVTSSNSSQYQFTALVSGLSSCSSSCGTSALTQQTVTIPTCPANFYANIPGQQLWVAGTASGSPTTPFGYGEFAFTSSGGTCVPGLSNGTVVLAPAIAAGFNGFNAHDNGYTLSNGVNADIEDTLNTNGHFHDLRWEYGTGFVGFGIQVNADEATGIDNINMSTRSPFRNDADFQSAGIFTPGGGAGAAILNLGENVDISAPASCIKHYSGNDLTWMNGICQNYSAGGVIVGKKRGGFGQFNIGPWVHFEVGGGSSPWGVPIGNPQIMVYGGGNINATQGSNGGGPQAAAGSAYPEFIPVATAVTSFTGSSGTLTFTTASQTFSSGLPITLSGFTAPNTGLNGQQVTVLSGGLTSTTFEAAVTGTGYSSASGLVTPNPSSQTHSQFYYVVAHTNAASVSPYATNCSSTDCLSVPVFIGACVNIDDPSAYNCSVNWYGWGANATSGTAALPNPSAYDLLAQTWGNTSDFPQVPTGTGAYAVATNLAPSSICSIHNICTVVDNVAPGSRSSYAVTYKQQAGAPVPIFKPYASLLPGIVSFSGDGTVNEEGTPSIYNGPGTCLNTMEGLGAVYVGYFTTALTNDVCPPQLGPIRRQFYPRICVRGDGQCAIGSVQASTAGSGFAVIAAGATSVSINIDEVTPYSGFDITEDMTQGSALGVTCNTTQGRTYSVTAKTPGQNGGFTITSSAAPTTNPACIRWGLK